MLKDVVCPECASPIESIDPLQKGALVCSYCGELLHFSEVDISKIK